MMDAAPVKPALKVLHVAQTAQGGVGSYLEEIMPLQVERYGHDAVRAVLPKEHAAVFPGISAQWLVPFAIGSGGRLASSCRMAGQVWRLLRDWRPDIVHLHSTFAGVVLRPLLFALPHRPRIVYCPHGWGFDRRAGQVQTRAIESIELALSRCCDAIVCVSSHESARAARLGIAAVRLRTLHNGIADLRAPPRPHESPWPAGTLRILFVGRLDSQKGVDVLFSAMRRLGQRAFAVVVGASVVADEGLAADPPPNVKISGWLSRPEIAALYANAQVLAMPSRWEGLPIAAIEAMRAGLPVVATRVGGLPELVEDGVSGRLINVDDPAQLAAVLAGLDAESLRAMGVHARQRYLREFQVDRVVRDLDGLYRSLGGRLAGAPGSGRPHGEERA